MFRLSTRNDNLIGICVRIIYGCMVQNAIKHERKYFEWSVMRVCVDFSSGFYSSFYYVDTDGKATPVSGICAHVLHALQ